MIEEAAGTRMYESKKLSAQKTIEKKETKLKEIETVTIFYINYTDRARNRKRILPDCYVFDRSEKLLTAFIFELPEVAFIVKSLY